MVGLYEVLCIQAGEIGYVVLLAAAGYRSLQRIQVRLLPIYIHRNCEVFIRNSLQLVLYIDVVYSVFNKQN